MEIPDVVEMIKELKSDINRRFDKVDSTIVSLVTKEQCTERMCNNKLELSTRQTISIITGLVSIIVATIAVAKFK